MNESTMFDLVGNWLTVYDMADDPEVNEDAFFDTLEAIEGEIEDKADGYAAVIARLKSDSGMIKEQESRLKARREAIENSIARMKYRLEEMMRLTGKTKIKTTYWSFGIQKNAPSVVLDTEDIPAEFLIPQPAKVDKNAIKEALKNDESSLKGIAHLEQTESLRIR